MPDWRINSWEKKPKSGLILSRGARGSSSTETKQSRQVIILVPLSLQDDQFIIWGLKYNFPDIRATDVVYSLLCPDKKFWLPRSLGKMNMEMCLTPVSGKRTMCRIQFMAITLAAILFPAPRSRTVSESHALSSQQSWMEYSGLIRGSLEQDFVDIYVLYVIFNDNRHGLLVFLDQWTRAGFKGTVSPF